MEEKKTKRKVWRYVISIIGIALLSIFGFIIYIESLEADNHNTTLLVPNQLLSGSKTSLSLLITNLSDIIDIFSV